MMLENVKDIAVVIASLNEEEGIGPTIDELRQVLGDPYFLLVDGNSRDKTVEIAKNLGADILYQTNTGKGGALYQGIQHLQVDGECYVVFTDADYTYPADHLPEMINVLESNPDVGMVIGNRFNGKFHIHEAINDMFYLGNRMLSFAQYLLNGIKLRDPLSGLRVVRWELLKNWKPKSSGFDVEAEMNHHIERQGYQIVETPIGYRARLGMKKLKFRHGLIILKRIITESLA